MGQLLVMLIVPPIIGLVTYFVVRFFCERDENRDCETIERRNLPTPAGGTNTGVQAEP